MLARHQRQAKQIELSVFGTAHLDEVYLKIAGRMACLWRLESVHYCMCWPPLIAILAPVTNAASSEHR